MGKTGILAVGLILAVSGAAQALVWDVLEENYGNGIGQISFVDSYAWPWGSDIPVETLNDGYATLSHGPGIDYAARENGMINLPEAPWRMDVKLQLENALGFSFYLGDYDYIGLRSLVQLNALYNETSPHPNTIGDYNQRIADGGDIAPAGFDGSALHVYSFRASDGKIDMYIDDAFVATLTLGAGIDSGYEAMEFGFGGSLSPGPGTSHVYYVKISTDLGTPPDTLPGDLNGDGMVGSADLDIVRGNWGQSVTPGDLVTGDPSGDGSVGSADLDIVRANWGATAPAVAVPEPSMVALLLLGLVLSMVTRKRPA